MPRDYLLIALLAAAAAASRTAAAAPSIDPKAPPVTAPNLVAPPRVLPATEDRPGPEIVLGSVQLVAGYGAEIGGLVGSLAMAKDIGSSDYTALLLAVAVMPALAAGAVCGAGTFSRSYNGRCSTTFVGAYAAAALGMVLGFAAAPQPGPDDTDAFVQSMTALIGVAVLTPIGAVIGYHAGKREIPRDRTATALRPPVDEGRMVATAAPEPRRGAPAVRPQVFLPLLSFSW